MGTIVEINWNSMLLLLGMIIIGVGIAIFVFRSATKYVKNNRMK